MYPEIIITLNNIKDNLWLMDLNAVNKLLIKLLEDREVNKIQQKAEEVNAALREISKGVERQEKETLTSLKIKQILEEYSTNIEDVIFGTLIKHLVKIRDHISQLVKQMEILPRIFHTDTYKYIILQQHPKYEIRAILKQISSSFDLKKLQSKLKEMGFESAGLEELNKYSFALRFYSTNAYIEAFVVGTKVQIFFSLREGTVKRVKELTTIILDELTQ